MDRRRGMMMGLASAAGAAAAFYGVRGLIRWYQRRENEEQRQARVTRRMQAAQQPASRLGYQPVDQPDRQPIPATGLAAPDVAELTASEPAVDISAQTGPLVEYLYNFYEMIELLRIRRREGNAGNGGRSLMPVDRLHFQEMADRLAGQMPDAAPADLQPGTLPARIDRLVIKLRDGLQNYEYTDDDLFRIYGEVRSEACKVLEALMEMKTDENLARVRQMYDCG